MIDTQGKAYPLLAQEILNLTADQVATAYIPPGDLNVSRMREQAWKVAEKLAGDVFSEMQLAHAQRLEAERRKVEKYYRQQEGAVKQIAIENIRQAKQRELLERRHADLKSLDERRLLVPDMELVGMALIKYSD